MTRTFSLAVVPGDGIGPEVTAQALAGPRRRGRSATKSRSSAPSTTSGAERWHATGETLPRLGARGDPRARRDPARRRSATRACRPASSSAACCSSCGSRSTTTSTCARRKLYPGRSHAARRIPGDIDFVVVREGTEGPYVGNGGAHARRHAARGRHRGQRQHGVRRRARRPRRLRPRAGPSAQEADAGPQEQRPGPRRPLVEPHRRRRGRGVPRRRRRLPARRRRDDLPGHRPEPLRRHRHRQPVRRHPHRPRRRGHRWHRPGRQRQHQPRPHHAEHVRAGPRLGTRHRRPGARPTRRRRSSPSACCSTTSACPRPRRGSRPPSRPTSPTAAPRRRAHEDGDEIGRPRHIGRARSSGKPLTDPRRSTTHHDLDLRRSSRNPAPRVRRRARGDPGQPGLRHALHRPHVPDRVDPRGAAGTTAGSCPTARYARPGHRGAALRAGDLRGPQGLPPRRRLDLASGPRPTPRASSARPAGWRCRSCRPSGSSARSRAAGHGGRAPGSRAAARRASTCGRSCSPPRCSSACGRPARTYSVIASPAGAYFAGGVKPVDIWLSAEYARAGAGGTGAAKCGGNYASSLLAAAGGHRQRLRPGGVPRRGRAQVGRGARRHEPVLRVRRRLHRHAGADRLDPRGRHPRLDPDARPRPRPRRRASVASPSTSGATARPTARSPRCSPAARPRSSPGRLR